MRLCYNSFLYIFIKEYNDIYPKKLINKMLIEIIDDRYSRIQDKDDLENDLSTYTRELLRSKNPRDITDELREKARDIGYDSILDNVNEVVVDSFKSNDKNNKIKGLLTTLVLLCNNIETNEVVFKYPEITKLNFYSMELPFNEFLANIIYFIFDKSTLSNEPFTESDYNLLVEKLSSEKSKAIDFTHERTLHNDSLFERTFLPITHGTSLSSKKPNDIKLFYLNSDADGLNYEDLKKCLGRNIGYYIYSRKQIKELNDDDALASIGYEAIKEVKENGGLDGQDVGNLILYSFIEFYLNAPKLFSNYEIDKYKISKSNAIHLLTNKDEQNPNNELVFGTSKIDISFMESIKYNLERLSEIKNKEEKSLKFVNSPIFYQSFDDELSKKLKDIILPSEETHCFASSSYSLFVGYKVDVQRNKYNNTLEYINAIKKQMIKDLVDNYNNIESEINRLGLNNRSIYIFVLPFNDPLVDIESIINEITLGGSKWLILEM